MKTVFKQFSKKTLSLIIALAVVICSFGTTLSTFMDFGAKAVGDEHFKVTYGSPAVPMFEKTTINLYDLKVQFQKDGAFIDGTDITWSAEAGTSAAEFLNATNKTFSALGTGIFKVTATETANTANTKAIYIMVNKKDDYNFYLVNENLKTATLPGNTWYFAEKNFGGDYANDWTGGSVTSIRTSSNTTNGYSLANGWVPQNSGLFYKNDILNDFADYTVLFGARHTLENIRGSFLNVVLRADLADNIAVGNNALAANSTALSLGIRPIGGLSLYGYGASSNPAKELTLHTVADSSLIKPQSSNVKYLFGNADSIGASANNNNFRDISIKLEGNDILYTLDGNTILDTTKDIKTFTAPADGANLPTSATDANFSDGTMTDETYENYMNGYNLGKGTVGFVWVRSEYNLEYLRVKLNNIDSAENMPVASEITLDTVSLDNPAVKTTTNTAFDLSNYIYEFEGGSHIGTALDFSISDKNASVNETYLTLSGKTFTATKPGVYTIDATYGTEVMTLYVYVTESATAKIYEVMDRSPAVPMFVNTKLDIANLAIQFENGQYFYGRDIVWSTDETNVNDAGFVLNNTSKTLAVIETGTYVLKATVTTDEGVLSRKVYFVVNKSGDYDFYLVNLDFLAGGYNAADWLYAAGSFENYTSATKYTVKQNNITAGGNGVTLPWGEGDIILYKNPMLMDFADYTVQTQTTFSSSYDCIGYYFGIITRANINTNAAVGSNSPLLARADGSAPALAVVSQPYGSPMIHVMNDSFSGTQQNCWEINGYNTIANVADIMPSTAKAGYCLINTTSDIELKVSGGDIKYSINGNVLLDSTAQTINVTSTQVNGSNYDTVMTDSTISSAGTLTNEQFNAKLAISATVAAGTVGFTACRNDRHNIRTLKVKLNDINADTVPYAEEYGPYIVKSSSPALPMTAGTKINLSNFMIQLGAYAYEASALDYSAVAAVQNGAVANGVKVENGEILAYKRGVYSVTATAKDGSGRTQKIYIVVKNADENEYVIYDKNYRDESASVADWKTTVVYNGSVYTGITFSGNYQDKVSLIYGWGSAAKDIKGFVPYNSAALFESIKGGAEGNFKYATYTLLDNDVVNSLSDYTITAGLGSYTNYRGAVGVVGRVTNTASGAFVPGSSNASGYATAYKDNFVLENYFPANKAFYISGESFAGISEGAVNDYYYAATSGFNRGFAYRIFETEFNGNNASLYNPNGDKVTAKATLTNGAAGVVTYTHDQKGEYLPTPIILDFKVSLKNLDLSNLSTSSIDYTPVKIPSVKTYTDNGNYKFSLNADGQISVYTKVDENKPFSQKVVIPAVVDGKKVSQVGVNVFFDNDASNTVAELVISEGITALSENAFRSNYFIDTVTLPNTLETIGKSVFQDSGIINLTIPSSTLAIEGQAFDSNLSLHTLTFGSYDNETDNLIHSKITTIGEMAFQNNVSLGTVSLPLGVKSLGASAFAGCTTLKSIYIYNRNMIIGSAAIPTTTTIYGATGSTAEAYATANGNVFVAIDTDVAAVEQAYSDYLAAIEAAAQLKANTVDTNAQFTFYMSANDNFCGVAGLISANTNAGKYVFPTHTDYTHPGTGEEFKNAKVTYVKANAFKECEDKANIYNVVLPEGYTEIQSSAFSGCTELRYITLPNTLNFIRDYAFQNNTWLKEIELPANLGEIGKGAFMSSGRLATVTFAEGSACYSIGEAAFQGTAVTSIKLPVHLRTIGEKAFADTPLAEIYILNRDAAIGKDAFPAGTVIHGIKGSTAEAYATANGLTFVADVTDTWDEVINKIDPNGKFTFSVDAQGRYGTAAYSAGGKIVIPYEIDYKAPDGTVTKGALVSKINVNIFKNVYNRFQVTSLVVPEGIVTIEDSSFIDCANLVKLTIPSSLRTVDDWAFSSADIHGELVFGINCSYIGKSAFANNNNLEAVYIYNPNCVIEDDAFVYSTNISINEKVTKKQRVKIYGVKGSTAETYASKNDHEFIEIKAGKFPEISAIKDNKNYTLTGDAATGAVVGYSRKDASKPYSEKVVFPAKLNGASMTTIQGSLFKLKPYTSSLVAAVIEEGYTSIGDSAFAGCERLTRVQLPSTLTEINNSAFANTAIAGDLVIPESVTKIGGSAFAGCTNLTSVTITNPTAVIGPNAFSEMTRGFTIRGLTNSTAEEYYTKYKKYGIKFEAIGEYIDPNAPSEEEEGPGEKGPGNTQQHSGDENANKITLFGVQVDDLTLIIIIGLGALMLILLIAGVVIVIIVVNSNDDDDDDDDDDDEDEDDEDEYDDEDE